MKLNVLLLAVFAASIAACSEDPDVTQSTYNELGLSASIVSSLSTRSIKEGFVAADVVSVFVTGTGYTPKLSEYTFSGTLWSSPTLDTSKIYLTSQIATVQGFFPSGTPLNPTILTNNNANGIEVTVDRSESSFEAAGQIDYMYAIADRTVTSSEPTAALAFHHGLAKISFIVNRSATFNGSGEITQIKLTKTAGFLTGTGVMNLETGIISGLTETDDITFTGIAISNKYNKTPSATKTFFGLVAPIAATNSITLFMTIDGKVYSATLPSGSPADLFESGKEYLYTITIKSGNLGIDSVFVVPWETKESGNLELSLSPIRKNSE